MSDQEWDLSVLDSQASQWDLSVLNNTERGENLAVYNPQPAKPKLTAGRLAARLGYTLRSAPANLASAIRSSAEAPERRRIGGLYADVPSTEDRSSRQEVTGFARFDVTPERDIFLRLSDARQAQILSEASDFEDNGLASEAAFNQAVRENQRKRMSSNMRRIENMFGIPEEFDQSSGFLEDVVGGIGTTLTSLPAYAVGPFIGALNTYTQIKGAKVQELEKLGALPANIDSAATFSALLQTPLEAAISIKALSTILKPAKTWTKTLLGIAETAVGEGLTEFVQTYPDEFATVMAMNPNTDARGLADRFIERLPETTNEAFYSALVGFVAAGITAGSGVSIRNMVNIAVTPEQKSVEQSEIYKVQSAVQKVQDGSATETDLQYLSKIAGVDITPGMSTEDIIAEAGDFADAIAPIESSSRSKIIAGISEVLGVDQAGIVTQVYDQMARAHAAANGVMPTAFYDLFSFQKAEIKAAEVTGPVAPDQFDEITEGALTGWIKDGYGLPEGFDTGGILFQDGPKDLLVGKPRGAVQGAFEESAKKVIISFQGADVSTMVHEIAHVKVSLLAAENPGSFEALAKWAGVDARAAKSLDISKWGRESLEKVAVGFEEYMREGKAPTAQLQPVFARIREWMIRIYGSLRSSGLQMNDEVRAIFDSWLASGQERLSEASNEVDEWLRVGDLETRKFNPKTATYDDTVWEARRRVLTGIREKRISQDSGIRSRLKEQAKKDVDERPEYLLISKIQKVGLDTESMRSLLSPDLLGRVIKRVPAGVRENGSDPLEFIVEFGFSGMDEMVAAILATKPKRVATAIRLGQLQAGFRATLKAENTKLYRDTIVEELKILEEITGEKAGKITDADIQATIDSRDDAQIISDIRRDNTLVKAAIASGKVEEALKLKALQKERISRIYEKREESENRAKIDRRMMKHWKSKALPEEYRAQLSKFLGEFYQVPDAYKAEPAEGLASFLQRKAETGGNASVAVTIIPDLFSLPVQRKDSVGRRIPLSTEDKKKISRVADQIAHMGKTESVLFKEEGKVEHEKTVAEMVGRGYETFGLARPGFPDDVVKRENLKPFDAVTDSLTNAAKDFYAWLRRTEFDLELIDGGLDGPNSRVFRDIVEARRKELELGEYFIEKLLGILGPYDSAWHTMKYNIPGSSKTFTKNELFIIACHSGSPDNLRALMGPNDPSLSPAQRQRMWDDQSTGNNLTKDQIDYIVNDLLTGQEIRSVNQIWDLFEEMYPLLNEIHKTLNGVELPRVEGKYFPIYIDKALSRKKQDFESLDQIANPMMNTYYKTSVYAKSRIERTGGRQPLLLDMSVISRAISDSIHDVTHQIPVRNALRIIEDGRFQQMYTDTLGEARYKYLQSWLRYVARPVKSLDNGIEKVMTYLRHNATIVGLGLKVTTSLKQTLSLTQTIDELNKLGVDGLSTVAKAAQDFYAAPAEGVAFADENSVFMRQRSKLYDRDAGEMLDSNTGNPFTGPLRKKSFQFFLCGLTIMDKAAVYPTWHAGYSEGLHKYDNDHKKAVEFADRLVRVTQPSNSPMDLSAIQRGREWERWASMFQGFFNVFLQRLGDTVTQYQLGKIDAFEAFKSYWWLIAVPASLPAVFAAAVPSGNGEPSEPDEEYVQGFVKKVAKSIILYPTAAFPGVRDVINAASGGRRFAVTPVEAAGEAAAAGLNLVLKGIDPEEEVSLDRARRVGVTLSGYLFGIPSAQINTVFDGLVKLQSGELGSPLALLYREPSEKKNKNKNKNKKKKDKKPRF